LALYLQDYVFVLVLCSIGGSLRMGQRRRKCKVFKTYVRIVILLRATDGVYDSR